MGSVPEPGETCWLHPDAEVRPSDIAGRGLVATADIPAGTVVSRLGGTLVDTATLHELMQDAGDYVDSIVVDEDRHLVLAVENRNRFGNHSCDPNLGWADEYSLETLRDVAAGEELVSDYAMSTTDTGFYQRCHCPSNRCRQMVEGSDWRIPQLQRRYDGHWVPYIQRLIDATKSQA